MGSISLRCGERVFDLWDHSIYDPAAQNEVETHRDSVIALGVDQDSDYIASIYAYAVRQGSELVTQRYSLASGGPSVVGNRSAVCIDARAFYAQGNQVACINLETGKLVWHVQADDATCFSLYVVLQLQAIIVHGELSISKLWLDGEISWQVYGRDIFTGPFQIHGNEVLATDFYDGKYSINVVDGRMLTDFGV